MRPDYIVLCRRRSKGELWWGVLKAGARRCRRVFRFKHKAVGYAAERAFLEGCGVTIMRHDATVQVHWEAVR